MIMRKVILSSLFLIPLLGYSKTEIPDSIEGKELNEVVVEASNQRTSSTSSTYIPMSRQKNTASDAISLLSQMAIPQLNVDPASQNVKTVSGQAVSIFIDYVAASAQDLSGMRTTDVKKVEYLIYPTDPRWHIFAMKIFCATWAADTTGWRRNSPRLVSRCAPRRIRIL